MKEKLDSKVEVYYWRFHAKHLEIERKGKKLQKHQIRLQLARPDHFLASPDII